MLHFSKKLKYLDREVMLLKPIKDSINWLR